VTRSPRTLAQYAAFGCLGYLLTGLGAIIPQLRAERGLTRVEAGLYPSVFALGLIVVGLTGHRATRALGRHAFPAALAALGAGAATVAAGPDRVTVAAGTLVLGLGAAGLVQLVPAGLRAEHGDRAAVAISEANAVSSSGSVLGPVAVGAALGAGPGWRVGFAGPPLVALTALLVVLAVAARRSGSPVTTVAGEHRHPAEAGPAGPAFLGWWLDLVLVVGVEFCLVFWAADFLDTESGLATGTATTLAAAFVLGMAAGRTVAGPVTRLVPEPARLLICAAGLAAAGFALFWLAGTGPVAVTGLLVAGLGVALLYPVTLARTLAAWPGDPQRAAARCALASGLAIGVAPLLLGALADTVGLRTAALLVPVLLLAFAAHCGVRLRRARLTGAEYDPAVRREVDDLDVPAGGAADLGGPRHRPGRGAPGGR
jgi:fucose permease